METLTQISVYSYNLSICHNSKVILLLLNSRYKGTDYKSAPAKRQQLWQLATIDYLQRNQRRKLKKGIPKFQNTFFIIKSK